MGTPTGEIESQALILSEQAKTLQVTDQTTYNQAVGLRGAIKDFLKGVQDIFEPMRERAYSAYQEVMKQRDVIKAPAETALKGLDTGISNWTRERERLQRVEQARLQQEANQRAEENRLARAVEVEQAGFDEESVQAVLAEPVRTETAVATPTYQKSSAIVTRDNWSGEIYDLWELAKAVAADKSKMNLIQGNQTAVNQMARALKETMDIPGIRAVNTPVVASTGRRR